MNRTPVRGITSSPKEDGALDFNLVWYIFQFFLNMKYTLIFASNGFLWYALILL